MIGGVLFFIIEFKLILPDANALAQLFLALLCAWFLFVHECALVELYSAAAKENTTIEFAGLRIYGLLTNAVTFAFYSYDPITRKFCFDETIIIANKRPSSLVDMVDGAYFFSS